MTNRTPSRPLRFALPAMLLVLALVAAACTRSNAATEGTAAPSGSTSPSLRGFENIQHVIFVVQENRSFDHYFGTFPGANGIPMKGGKPSVCIPDPVLGTCVRPFHEPALINQGGPHDLSHSAIDVNGGAMDGFVRAVAQYSPNQCARTRLAQYCEGTLGPQVQPDVLGWHDAREIPNYWAYAEHFVLQDRMFAPTDSWTLPAHLFLVSGWSARCDSPWKPMSCKTDLLQKGVVDLQRHGEHPPLYAWTDITWLLHREGIGWAYYAGKNLCGPEVPVKMCAAQGATPAQNPLPSFTDAHQTLSFDAYLKLIEDLFLGGQRLNPKTDGRPDSRPTVREDVNQLGDLRNEFDFTQQPLPPLILDPHPSPGPASIPGT